MLTTLALLAAGIPTAEAALPATIRLDPSHANVRVSPDLYGIFFEEINHAGDGGIYAEMLGNRGFEQGTDGGMPSMWRLTSGEAALDPTTPFNDAKPRSLKLSPGASIANDGFWGLPLQKGKRYKLVLYTRGGAVAGSIGGTSLTLPKSVGWKRTEITVKPLTAGNTALELRNTGADPAWIGWTSLMPVERVGRAPMRVDLEKRILAIHPGFVRFPGGCYVEGQDLGRAFDWKKALGAPETRPGKDWRFWGYPSTDGLGLHEYLQWCEDLGAAPLFVVNCGISHSNIAPMSEMEPYVQSALDAIEYANGPTTSQWGALRAKNGHPKPFGLKYIEIGNENGAGWSNGGPEAYGARYKLIYDAIKKSYPQIVTIADNPIPHPMEMIDEHYYSNPPFFWQNSTRYDSYNRRGPKIYVGEFAVTQDCGRGNLKGALAEAAFMTGMERNSDVVRMASYAPLFENSGHRQWNPNAIQFDASRTYGTPSYWVQALFGENRPDRVIPLKLTAMSKPVSLAGGIGLKTWRSNAEFKDIKVTSNGAPVSFAPDWQAGRGNWKFENGIAAQTGNGDDSTATPKGLALGDSYTIDLKARKTGGDEGFIVMFGVRGGDYVQWNVGGWVNTRIAFEVSHSGERSRLDEGVRGSVETNRWYDVRLDVSGAKVKAYLDGKLIQEAVIPATPSLAAVAGIDEKKHETVLKVVNGSDSPRRTAIDLGAEPASPAALATVLTSGSLEDENSFDAPEKVAPRKRTVYGLGRRFTYTFPPRSLTILRIKR